MLKNALLWEITHSDFIDKSYIFGTIHINTPSTGVLIDMLEKYADSVDTVFTEAPLNAEIPREHYLLPDERTIRDYMTTKQYDKLSKICMKAFSFDLSLHQRLLPMLISQNLGVLAVGFDGLPSLDASIYQMARRLCKQYKGLESTAEQLSILRHIPIKYQVKALLKMSRNVRTFRNSFKKLISFYESENIIEMYRGSKKQLGSIRKMLLYNRNVLMTDRIYNHSKSEKCLFTFGAGHLAGEKGVLTLLKKRKVQLRPIPLINR